MVSTRSTDGDGQNAEARRDIITEAKDFRRRTKAQRDIHFTIEGLGLCQTTEAPLRTSVNTKAEEPTTPIKTILDFANANGLVKGRGWPRLESTVIRDTLI